MRARELRRQHPIGHFIVDFYCTEAHLVIEIDGESHSEQVQYDLLRTVWLEEQGSRVICFLNKNFHQRFDDVIAEIERC